MRTGAAILGLLSDADADWLVSVAQRLALGDEDVLIADRSRPGALFILVAGRLRVTAGDPPKTVAMLNPGAILGEVSFIDGWPATAGVSAIGPTTVLKIDADVLRAELAGNEGFSSRFWRALAVYLTDRLRKTALGDKAANAPDERSADLRAEVTDAEAQGDAILARLNRQPAEVS